MGERQTGQAWGRSNLQRLSFAVLVALMGTCIPNVAFSEPTLREKVEEVLGKEEVQKIMDNSRDKGFCGDLKNTFIAAADAQRDGVPRSFIEKFIDPPEVTDKIKMLKFTETMRIIDIVYSSDGYTGIVKVIASNQIYTQCMENISSYFEE